MANEFQPGCLPLLIGGLPLGDHREEIEMVFKCTPEIPIWIQLPLFEEERMLIQFLSGMPGLAVKEFDGTPYIDMESENFSTEMFLFFEEYMDVTEGRKPLDESRFVLKQESARGFYMLLEHIVETQAKPTALKGQITGPFTLCTGVKDQEGKAIFYDDQLREAAVKLLAMKSVWQIRELKKHAPHAILFLDEPAMTGFGSSEYISISRDDVMPCFKEIIEAIHQEGGLAGIHVCSNADWSLIMDTGVDIVSFDSYIFFDKFAMYSDLIKKFIEEGRMIAWGIVPTMNVDDIEKENANSLLEIWDSHIHRMKQSGVDKNALLKQSFITPSCGMGSLSFDHARKLMKMTRDLSKMIRNVG